VSTLAAIATLPERARLLSRALHSLRPQVDRLHVYLNGHEEPPEYAHLADEVIRSSTNEGAERKLWWAEQWDGIYLSCDDDFIYPPDYVERMVAEVERWRGRAIVTAHGRTFHTATRRARRLGNILEGSRGGFWERTSGRWINYAGTGVAAWDASKIKVPSAWPRRNMVDLQLALWAQRNRVPMWLQPHPPNTFVRLNEPGTFTIWGSSKAERHASRNALISEHDAKPPGWVLYACSS
jgi:hypothetical protein